MSQFIVLPPAGVSFESQPSPTFALVSFLPVVSLPEQYPALPAWVYALCDQVGSQTREEYGLLTVLLFRSYALFVSDDEQMESVESFLAHLSAMGETAVRDRVLRGLASSEGDGLPATEWDASLRTLLEGASLPVGNEFLRPDVDRASGLIMNPVDLKRFMIERLRAVWFDRLQPHWEKHAALARQQAAQARRHFTSADVAEVFRAVTGRPFPQAMVSELGRIRRVVFSPIPFYGPYCVCSFRPEAGELRVGYGVGIQPAAVPAAPGAEGAIPGGLLPVLEALADETRLQILALIRDRGQGSAQEFMAEFGLSQPATSRHLRLLETTGLLLVERVEGIKWYRLNQVRIDHVMNLVRAFLTPAHL